MTFENKSVAIILCYFEGMPYISSQVNSICAQTHTFFHLYIFDDCSKIPLTFDSLGVDYKWRKKITIFNSKKNIGHAKNFINSLQSISDDFDFYAFSDQDDVWYPEKLERAINAIKVCPLERPVLYGARTEIVNADGQQKVGLSPLFKRPLSFRNALVQNFAGGNTMVMNKASKAIVAESGKNRDIVAHDWWCYLIVSGAGGDVLYDPLPCLKYRQHLRNSVGSNNGWGARISRLKLLMQGRYKNWIDINLKNLVENEKFLLDQNKKILYEFHNARKKKFFKRLIEVSKVGVYRQTALGSMSLLAANMFGKL